MSLLRTLLAIVVLLSAAPLFATPHLSPTIPDPLKPWVPWVLERDTTRGCPEVQGAERCVWYRSLALDVNPYRGSFSLSVELDAPGMVKLPGDDMSWPQAVRLKRDGAEEPIVVLQDQSSPYVELGKGSYEVKGIFTWGEWPPSLLVPPEVVTLNFTQYGSPVAARREVDGRVWFQTKRNQAQVEQDTLSISISRRLSDGIPFLVDTHVTLKVSGKARQVTLDNLVPSGATYLGHESSLRLGHLSGGKTRIDVIPGVHAVRIKSLFSSPPEKLEVSERVGDEWPYEEYWSWNPNLSVRRVELQGGVEANPFELPIPDEWRTLTTFALRAGSTLVFKEVQRGSVAAEEKPTYALERTAWLTPEGDSFDTIDTIRGQTGGARRLEAEGLLTLKRATVFARPIMISRDPATRAHGVELRSPTIDLSAEGSISRSGELPAIGWNTEMRSVKWALHLPPGWTPLSVKGPDWVKGDWWHSWTLESVIVSIVVLLGLKYLYSWRAVLFGSIVLLLPDHTTVVALVLALSLAIVARALENRWKGGAVILNIVAVICLLLSVGERLFTLFLPHLSMRAGYSGEGISEFIDVMLTHVNGSLGALIMVSSFFIALVTLAMRYYRPSALFAVLAVGAFFARALVGAQFNDASLSAGHYLESDGADYAAAPQGASEGGARREYRKDKASMNDSLRRIAFDTVDPHSLPQTGEGVPQWGRKYSAGIEFGWSDSLSPGEEAGLKLTLLSPLEMKIVGSVQLAGLLLLAFTILRISIRKEVIPLAILLFVTPPAHAEDYPSVQLLTELEERLTSQECKRECLTNPRLSLSIDDVTLTFEGEVHSRGISAYPLPTASAGMDVEKVEIDGVEAPLSRVGDIAWVRVPDGVHTLRIEGTLMHPSYSILRFHMRPRYFTYSSGEWSVSGLNRPAGIAEVLHLSRAQEKGGWQSGLVQPRSWYRIRRSISLGASWRVRTSVDRHGDISQADQIVVRLLRGEVPEGSGVLVEGGAASVTFRERETQVSWEGELPKEGPIELFNPEYIEEWTLSCSTTWRCSWWSPIRASPSNTNVADVTFHPEQGEKLIIEVVRPEGVEGLSKAVVSARAQFDRKKRESRGDLHLVVRSNKRDSELIALPPDATVTSVTRSHEPLMIKQEGAIIRLPLEQGEHDYRVQWSMPRTAAVIEALPSVKFESTVKNIEIVAASDERWVVWLEQRGWGPFVGWWLRVGAVFVATLLVFLIERKVTSLLWCIPFLGIVTFDSVFVLLIPLAVLVLTLVKERTVQRAAFGVALFAVVAAFVGVLGTPPDMSIMGQEHGSLRWFIPEKTNEIPSVTITSLPRWVWQLFVALWAALAGLFVYVRLRSEGHGDLLSSKE